MARICRVDGKEIPYEDIVKGYEYRKGDYVVLSDEDFKRADPEKTKTIDIVEFVDEGEIDVRFFDAQDFFWRPDTCVEDDAGDSRQVFPVLIERGGRGAPLPPRHTCSTSAPGSVMSETLSTRCGSPNDRDYR